MIFEHKKILPFRHPSKDEAEAILCKISVKIECKFLVKKYSLEAYHLPNSLDVLNAPSYVWCNLYFELK